jgi:hypothetical protein
MTTSHLINIDLHAGPIAFGSGFAVTAGDDEAAMRRLDALYDRVRSRMARAPWPFSYRFALGRHTATVDATTECVGSSDELPPTVAHAARAALEVLDRAWIHHRHHIARFAAQERL